MDHPPSPRTRGPIPSSSLWVNCVFGLLLVACGPRALAQAPQNTLLLKPAADACLFETSPDNNLGGALSFPVGVLSTGKRSRALIRFDVSSAIPSNSLIDSVELTIRVPVVGGSADSATFQLHRLLKSWGEGTKVGTTGAAASAGEVTWNSRFHPDQKWSAPGGVTNADFVGAGSSSVEVSGASSYLFPTTVDLVADVSLWVRNPSQNSGWIIMTGDESILQSARRVASREDTTNAATLKITYREVDLAHPIERIEATSSSLVLHLNLAANARYTLEYRESFAVATPWKTLTNFPFFDYPLRYVVEDRFGTNAQRFYRLRASPQAAPPLAP